MKIRKAMMSESGEILRSIVFAALALCAATAARGEEPRYFAIRNVHIVTVSGQ